MTRDELATIELALKIQLPVGFADILLDRGSELRALTYQFNGVDRPFFTEATYLEPEAIITNNLAERKTNSATSYAFPKWWKTYFIFATDGAGGFYCLRFDNEPGVYLIGSDCDDPPAKSHSSFEAFLKDHLDRYEAKVTYVPLLPAPPDGMVTMLEEGPEAYGARRYEVPELEKSFLDRIIAAPSDLSIRMEFADALEANGQVDRAKFIRARCVLDDRAPKPDRYPDAVEALAEVSETIDWDSPSMPAGFKFYSSDSDLEEWWSDESDAMELGLPSMAGIEITSDEPEIAAASLARWLPGLIQTTPIRGLDLEWEIPDHAGIVFQVPEVAQLTRLKFDSRPQKEMLCPVIEALIASPMVKTLARLEPGSVNNHESIKALAGAPFERLRRFDAYIAGDGEHQAILRRAPWFRNLHRHRGNLKTRAEAESMTGMPNLHTLCLWFPEKEALIGLGETGEFPALRRLFIHAADLTGDVSQALAKIRSPHLVELWLRNSAMTKADLKALLAAPWAERLQVLTLEIKLLDEDAINSIGASPCSGHLRILRFSYSGFPRLAGTALGKPGVFPNLTTLEMKSAFNADDPKYPEPKKKDTVKFLRTLNTPKLKRLKMSANDLVEGCYQAIADNPSIKNAKVDSGY